MKTLKHIDFSKEERSIITQKIQNYFEDELDREIGQIPAEMLLQFMAEEFGRHYYILGLRDAQTAFSGKIDEFDDVIYGLEQAIVSTPGSTD